MTKENLYNYADKENINISYTNNLKKSNGIYMKVNDEDYIILDNKLDGIDEKMALAEEIIICLFVRKTNLKHLSGWLMK